MTIGRVNPQFRLEDQGIEGLGAVYYNLIESDLVEVALKRGEGTLGRGGALLVTTGKFTGRSPKDKHIVKTADIADNIWWENNAEMSPEAFDALFNRGLANFAMGRMAAADQDFSAVLREYPADAGAYYHRARARSAQNPAAAVADYDQASMHAPEWADPWFESGKALERLGRVDEANQRYRRAFELGHKDPWLLQRITSLGG